MNSSTQNSCRLAMPHPLAVAILADEGATPVAREPVTPADLADAVAEAWRERCLRRGHPDKALGQVPMELVPLLRDGNSSSRCAGFALEVKLPTGQAQRQVFSVSSLSAVADRAADALVATGVFGPRQQFVYELVTELGASASPPSRSETSQFSLTVNTPPPACLRLPLRPLLRQATAVEMLDEEAFPVFFTAHALARAEAFSRAGGEAVPAVESGGVLVGSLAVCETTREFFAIIADVIEVRAIAIGILFRFKQGHAQFTSSEEHRICSLLISRTYNVIPISLFASGWITR